MAVSTQEKFFQVLFGEKNENGTSLPDRYFGGYLVVK
jgi:hypothetical protein